MAAIILRRRQSTERSTFGFENLPRTERLPPTSQIKQDTVLGVLSAGKTWRPQRVVCTTDLIAFSNVSADHVLDKIHLQEIIAVERFSSSTSQESSSKSLVLLESPLDFSRSFQIRTIPNGHNCGRKYVLQAESETACSDLVSTLQCLVHSASLRSKSPGQRRQEIIRRFYDSKTFQLAAVVLIIMNFFASITEAQMQGKLINPNGSPTTDMLFLDHLNLILTIIFTVELFINMYAHWMLEFFTNSWAVFDLMVVTLSLITLGPLDLPISVLRALRVLRVFGRFSALKKILAALSASITPMLNAFFIMLIVSMIYAIMGVAFFSEVAPDEFATFDRAFFALFRLSAGETWLDSLQRLKEDGTLNYGPNLFVFSYIVIVVWVLLQVSVAVLIDNFVTHTIKEEDHAKLLQKLEGKGKSENTNPLEPLLQKLLKGFVDDADLTAKIETIFQTLDEDDNGKLKSSEFCTRLKSLDSAIHMSEADFHTITQNLSLCDENGEVGLQEFQQIMRSQLRFYIQTRLTDFTENRTDADIEFNNICTMKMVFSEVLALAREQQETRKSVQHILSHLVCSGDTSISCTNMIHTSISLEQGCSRTAVASQTKISPALHRRTAQLDQLHYQLDQSDRNGHGLAGGEARALQSVTVTKSSLPDFPPVAARAQDRKQLKEALSIEFQDISGIRGVRSQGGGEAMHNNSIALAGLEKHRIDNQQLAVLSLSASDEPTKAAQSGLGQKSPRNRDQQSPTVVGTEQCQELDLRGHSPTFAQAASPASSPPSSPGPISPGAAPTPVRKAAGGTYGEHFLILKGKILGSLGREELDVLGHSRCREDSEGAPSAMGSDAREAAGSHASSSPPAPKNELPDYAWTPTGEEATRAAVTAAEESVNLAMNGRGSEHIVQTSCGREHPCIASSAGEPLPEARYHSDRLLMSNDWGARRAGSLDS